MNNELTGKEIRNFRINMETVKENYVVTRKLDCTM